MLRAFSASKSCHLKITWSILTFKVTKNKYPHRQFRTDWVLPKLEGPDYWVHHEILTNTSFMIRKFFFAEWIYI